MAFIYVKDDGYAAIMDFEIDLGQYPGYSFFGVSDDKRYFDGKKYVGGQWVSGDPEPEYQKMRHFSYPNAEALFLALWLAMDTGVLPKVPGFYDKIKEVNDRFPPT
jgi:hypothetical protein